MEVVEKIERALEIDPEKVEKTIVDFLRMEVSKAGAAGVVFGLSGGVDSAVVGSLCARAFGPEKVLALLLPEREVTPKRDIEDAKMLAKGLGIRWREIDISPILRAFRGVIEGRQRLPIANLKPRVRMTLLYYHANLLGRLVVGTGNRSELRMGYFTKFGDGGADLMPLGSLYKTQVKKLAEYLGVPASIIRKTPSAGLWRGQTDEGELGISYEKLDRILVGLDLGFRSREIAEALGVGVATVEGLIEREKRNAHKLRPALIPTVK
ncbi:MAG: NAD+ synthase [Candidatus Hadarchaeales archaeon]